MSEDNFTRRALIFDFDGLILDTETAEVKIWEDLYAQVGLPFDIDAHRGSVGTSGSLVFDPAQPLADREGESRSFEQIRAQYRQKAYQNAKTMEAMEGVVDLIASAKAKGYLLAVGSSASYSWVGSNLARLGLLDEFDVIVTSDDVENAKPDPDIFLKVLEKLGVSAQNALVFEDSQNGVLAAHRAGIRAIAVPNPITAFMDFSLATAVIPTLLGFDPDEFF
ncbi:MAG: HAD-IA family hydrolase [Anaerolineaceae bacterium]